MYKQFLFCLILATSTQASEANLLNTIEANSEKYSRAVPVLPNEKNATNYAVGQIFYDISAGGYKGINKDGKVDILSNEPTTQKQDPSAVLSTDPKGRKLASALIEIDVSDKHNVTDQDGLWITSIETKEVGTAKLTLSNNIFSKNPICTCSPVVGGNVTCKFEAIPNNKNIIVATLLNGNPANIPLSIICVGSK